MVLCFGLMIPSRLWCMRRLWHDEWRRRIGPNGFNMDRLLEVEDLRNRGGKGGGKRRRRGGRGDWSQNRRSMQPWRPAGEKPKCVKFASSLQEEREMTLQCYGMLVWAGPRVKDAGCRFCAVGHNACRRRGRRSKPPLRRYGIQHTYKEHLPDSRHTELSRPGNSVSGRRSTSTGPSLRVNE